MKRLRPIWICTAGIAFCWLIYFFVGTAVSQKLGARFAAALLRATQGNVDDPAIFIRNRFCEGLMIVTFLIAAAWLHIAITKIFLRKSTNKTRHWITHAVSGFVLFNLWLGLTMQTTLFWCLMWQGEATNNFTRFHLKRLLFAENQSPAKAVILGNSQSRAQIDEEILNKILDPKLHTAELHFPGSNAYDVMLIHRKIAKLHPNLIIIYISEASFYIGNHLDVAANFFQFSDSKDLLAKDVLAYVPHRGFGYGLLGAALPIFRLRDVLSQRLLGIGITQLKQRQVDEKHVEDLDANGKKFARDYHIDESSDFEMRAFTEFVSDCERGNENVLIFAGQLNPLLGERFDPKIRTHMLSFLQKLRDEHSNVVLVDNLPRQSPADYEDLTHVKKEKQIEFTQMVAELLKQPFENLQKSAIAGNGKKSQIQN